jgi:hypothetical protein
MKGFVMILLMITLGASTALKAQENQGNRGNRRAMEQIEAARIAMITERLGLTPDQAQRFWPLYNEFSQRRQQIRAQLNEARRGMDPANLSEQESQRLMEMSLEIRQSEVNLEKEYTGKFRDVISAQQILALRKAEDDFRRLILQRIEDRQRQQMNRQRMLQRQEDQRRRGNN